MATHLATLEKQEEILTAVGGAAKPSDLSALATSAQLAPLAKSTELSPLAKSTELSPLAKSSELTPLGTLAKQNTILEEVDLRATKHQVEDLEVVVNRIDWLLRGEDFTVHHAWVKYGATGGNELLWHDPPSPRWGKTIIVRKSGSYPADINDGTRILVETTRDQYALNAYTDTTGASTDFYAAFVATAAGVERPDACQFKTYHLFGFYLDESDASSATNIHYTDDNTDFTPASMDHATDTFSYGNWQGAFFMGYPAMVRYDGTIDYRLDPNDLTKKIDGTASDVADLSYGGNAMQIMPSIYTYTYRDNGKVYFKFCSVKLNNLYECWNTKRSDGTYADWFGLPLFEGTVSDGKLRSIATGAKPTNGTNSTSELSAANANGDNWYPTTWADEMLMQSLFYLVFRTTRSREALGCVTNNVQSSLCLNCGSMTNKGPFYGKLLNTALTPIEGIKYFGMENWWSHRFRRSQGFVTVDRNILVKMTPSTIDGTTTNNFITTDTDSYTGSYLSTGKVYPSGSYVFIKQIQGEGVAATAPMVSTGASSSTYLCDVAWSNTGVRGGYFGGGCNAGRLYGVGCSYLYDAPSLASWTIGASLSYHFF